MCMCVMSSYTICILYNGCILSCRLHEKMKHLEDLLTKSEGSIERLERDLVQATKVLCLYSVTPSFVTV